jgi:hypothetical protein
MRNFVERGEVASSRASTLFPNIDVVDFVKVGVKLCSLYAMVAVRQRELVCREVACTACDVPSHTLQTQFILFSLL